MYLKDISYHTLDGNSEIGSYFRSLSLGLPYNKTTIDKTITEQILVIPESLCCIFFG